MKLFDTWAVDPVSELLGTGFNQFRCKRYAINGLAKETPGRLEILAIHSERPSHGNFRQFIKACQDKYCEIVVWEIGNPVVEEALARYGFVVTQKYEAGREEPIKGMIWTESR